MDAINRLTLKSRLANSGIRFASYAEYERMHALIDGCASLSVVPTSWMEAWADRQTDREACHAFIRRALADWQAIDQACGLSESDIEGEEA